MKKEELEKELNQKFDDNPKNRLPAAMIQYQGTKGIALLLGESLATGIWLSGDVIVHWEDGEHTILPDEFDLIKEDVWSI